jgi:hypothetical protein
MQTIELNQSELRILTQLNENIQKLQGQLQVALAVVMASRNIDNFSISRIDGNKIYIEEGTV